MLKKWLQSTTRPNQILGFLLGLLIGLALGYLIWTVYTTTPLAIIITIVK